MPHHKLTQAVQDALKHAHSRPNVIARHIVDLLLPANPDNIGGAFYKSCATGWLTQLLRATPTVTLPELVRQVNALCAISPAIMGEIGCLSGRLNQLVQA